MQKILRSSYNIVLFTYNRYFTCPEAVNLVQQVTAMPMIN